ncbi:MAG: LicD family protein [Bacteroidales bacterium]|nr:LicD family protein [Bacteroidales bacterium]
MNTIDTPALRAKYSPDGSDLRKAQLRMLEILKSVDEICVKHGIQYWLTCGTLLGAVRHGGFIPWDDDLDIAVMRKDYKKLMEILPKELPSNLELQDERTEENYVYLYSKVRDKNSHLEEIPVINKTFKNQGLFIDIFPMEESAFCFCAPAAHLFNRMCIGMVLKKGLGRVIYKMSRFFLLKILFPIFRGLSVFFPKGRIHHTYGVNFLQEKTADMIFPVQRIKFEDAEFNAPADTAAYLTKHFGPTYMSLPKNITVHTEEGSIKVW